MDILRFRVAVLACLVGFVACPATAFDIVNRWTHTQVDGGGIQRGDPITLLWSVVPDGHSYDRSSNSDLVGFMDDQWSIAAQDRSPDLTNRPWFMLFQQAYDQYSDVSGLTMTYAPELNSDGSNSNQSGDIRVGGEPFDPNGNVLADNTFPNSGDMRIDTSETPFYRPSNPQGVINLISHESGHGIGLGHTTPHGGAESVMEGGLQTHFFGFQFDDVYAVNRSYGDPYEKESNNDVIRSGMFLGEFNHSGTISLGTDATDLIVEQHDSDWLGIDGSTDVDYFRFSVPENAVARVSLTPVGPTYTTDENGQFNASAQSDLSLTLYGPNRQPILAKNDTGLGGSEDTGEQTLLQAGNYYIGVDGDQDSNQFYQLDLQIDISNLVLNVDRRTGAASVEVSGSQALSFSEYSVGSAHNNLTPANGAWLSLQDQQTGGFQETSATPGLLSESSDTGDITLQPGQQLSLGNLYRPSSISEPFGTPHEPQPLTFDFVSSQSGNSVEGAVAFTGEAFPNTLVLSVDPETGSAILINESHTVISLSGYEIASPTNHLHRGNWLSLEDQGLDGWEKTGLSRNLFAETNFGQHTVLDPFEILYLGELFSLNGEQQLGLRFYLDGLQQVWDGLVVYENVPLQGDFNDDGTVDAADYAVWRNSLNETGEGLLADANRDQVVDQFDYKLWRYNFGRSTLLAGENALPATAPEPAGVLLLLPIAALLGRRKQRAGRLN